MTIKKIIRVSLLSLAVSLTGCATHQSALLKIDTQKADIEQKNANAQEDQNISQYGFTDTLYFAGDAIVDRSVMLPEYFNDNYSVRWSQPITLFEFSQIVNASFNQKVRISKDVTNVASTNQGTQGSNFGPSGTMVLNHNGNLSSLLNYAAAATGTHWKYSNDEIIFYAFDTRTFVIDAVVSTTKLNTSSNNDVGGQSSGTGGTNSSSSSNLTLSSENKAFDAIKQSIEAMISTDGRITVNKSSNTITVRESPAILDNIEKLVNQVNARMSRQVRLVFTFATYTEIESENEGLSGSLSWQSLSGLWGTNVTGSSGNDTVDSIIGETQIIDTNHNYDGTRLAIDALAKHTKLSSVRKETLLVKSNQPASIHVGSVEDIITNVLTTISQVGTTTTVQTEPLSTGFVMDVIPTILSDNDIDLAMNFNVADLADKQTLNFGDSVIQTTKRDGVSKTLISKVRPGETILLASYTQDRNQNAQKGTGQAKFWALGGGKDSQLKTEHVIILVTPKIIN